MAQSINASQRIKNETKLFELSEEFGNRTAYLIQTWANCESWFMRILAVLLNTDHGRADLVFASFTSTRARVELVKRAAIMCLPKTRDIRHLNKLCSQFDAVTKMRNKLCHAEYTIGGKGKYITGFFSRNYQRRDFDGTNHSEHRRIDKGLINEMLQSSRSAISLCGRLERFVMKHEGNVLKQPRSQPVPLDKILGSKARRSHRKKVAARKRPH